MINLFKKHKYKLLTFMLSIVSFFTLFLGINKTYAYESNQWSYTIDTISLQHNENTQFSYDSTNHTITRNSTIGTSCLLDINLNTSIIPKGYYLLINYDILISNDNITYSSYSSNSIQYLQLYRSYSNNTANYYVSYGQYKCTSGIRHNNMYTAIAQPYNQIDISTEYSILYLNLSAWNGVTSQYSKLIIYNIDLVKNTDIGLSQYYDTYYSQIEDNYNALLSDYNDLQNDYDTLEGNYNTLQDNYDTLENNYNDLQDNYDNLSDIGIYGDFYNCSVSVENTTLTFNQLIDNSLLVNNTIYFGKILNYLNLNNTDLKIIYINFNKRLNTNNINYTYWDDVSGIYFDLNMIDDNDEEYTTSYYNNIANPQIINSVMLNNDQVPTGNTTYDINNKIYDQMQFKYSRVLNDNVGLSSSTLYIQGYNVGYNAGTSTKNEIYEDRINVLNNRVNDLEEANQMQYNAGYQQGLNVGANQNLETAGMKTLFNSILSYPVNMIRSVFDFEFMGINITSLIMFIVSIGIVAFVIKKFL